MSAAARACWESFLERLEATHRANIRRHAGRLEKLRFDWKKPSHSGKPYGISLRKANQRCFQVPRQPVLLPAGQACRRQHCSGPDPPATLAICTGCWCRRWPRRIGSRIGGRWVETLDALVWSAEMNACVICLPVGWIRRPQRLSQWEVTWMGCMALGKHLPRSCGRVDEWIESNCCCCHCHQGTTKERKKERKKRLYRTLLHSLAQGKRRRWIHDKINRETRYQQQRFAARAPCHMEEYAPSGGGGLPACATNGSRWEA